MLAVPPFAICEGGTSPSEKLMATGCGRIVTVTLTDSDGSLVAAAVSVTVLPMGTYCGALYTMAMLLPS